MPNVQSTHPICYHTSYMQSADPCRNPYACPTAVQSLVTLYVLTLHLYQCTCTSAPVPVFVLCQCATHPSHWDPVSHCVYIVHCTSTCTVYIYLHLYCTFHQSVTSHHNRDPWILPPLPLDAHFIISRDSYRKISALSNSIRASHISITCS